MLCDVCKKNNATIHVTQIINGVKKEYNMCELCAKDKNYFGNGNDVNKKDIPLENVLSGLIDFINGNSYKVQKNSITCSNCGLTYDEFKERGLLGCSKCYEEFNSYLNPIIKRIQANTEHVGKIPKMKWQGLIKKKKIDKLKESLNNSIAMEEYEKAAKIRDEIRELKKVVDGGSYEKLD